MSESRKFLEELLGGIKDVERDYYELLKQKMTQEEGVKFQIFCSKLNLKDSPEIKILNLLKPYISITHSSSGFIGGKYKKRKVSQSLRDNMQLIPLFLDDEVEVSFICKEEVLFKVRNLLSDLTHPTKLSNNKKFLHNILENNPIYCQVKLLTPGPSRNFIEQEILNTENHLNEQFTVFKHRLDRSRGYPPAVNTSNARLELLGFNVEKEKSRKFIADQLPNIITLSHITQVSKDLMVCKKIMQDFFNAVSNEKLLKLHADQQKYVDKLNTYIQALQKNEPLVPNEEGFIEIPVGQVTL